MAKRVTNITLDCGITANQRIYSGYEFLEIDLNELYNGYDTIGPGANGPNTFLAYSKLFAELHEKGYTGTGISTITGYYDSVDGLRFEVKREIVK